MLRITRTEAAGAGTTLRLEGRIAAEWVDVLEQTCREEVSRHRDLLLDLMGVTHLDRAGRKLMRRLHAEGIRTVNCPPLVRRVLEDD